MRAPQDIESTHRLPQCHVASKGNRHLSSRKYPRCQSFAPPHLCLSLSGGTSATVVPWRYFPSFLRNIDGISVMLDKRQRPGEAGVMRLPFIRGVIDRRILANWRVDPKVLARQLLSAVSAAIGERLWHRRHLSDPSAIHSSCAMCPEAFGMTSWRTPHIGLQSSGTPMDSFAAASIIPRRAIPTRSLAARCWAAGFFPDCIITPISTIMRAARSVSTWALDSDDGQIHVVVNGQGSFRISRRGSVFWLSVGGVGVLRGRVAGVFGDDQGGPV